MKLDRSMKRRHLVDGFGIEILFPGLGLNKGDSGIGAIGRIDHARITPGTVVPMHPHRDDEILTYLRSGKLNHRDTVGNSEDVSSVRLMLMNAGHTFQHEEEALSEAGLLRGLQIFIRPRAANLEPHVQFHDFDNAYSKNEWRLIAGPSIAPLILRSETWVHDLRLDAGLSLHLPEAPASNAARLLYVFEGHVNASGIDLKAGESLLLDAQPCEMIAQEQSDLVLFTTDLSAPVFKGGMFSGNILVA